MKSKFRKQKKPKIGRWENEIWDEYVYNSTQLSIRIFREARKQSLSTADLARKAQLSYQTVYNLEYFITRLPSDATLWKLMRAVGMRHR